MSKPPKEVFEAVVRTMDRKQANAAFLAMGFKVTQREYKAARQALVAADPRINASVKRGPVTDPLIDARKSSEKLEMAVRAFYAKVARQRRCSPEAAQVILNYTPGQIAKMGRAA
jgi:hypothetical protein